MRLICIGLNIVNGPFVQEVNKYKKAVEDFRRHWGVLRMSDAMRADIQPSFPKRLVPCALRCGWASRYLPLLRRALAMDDIRI